MKKLGRQFERQKIVCLKISSIVTFSQKILRSTGNSIQDRLILSLFQIIFLNIFIVHLKMLDKNSPRINN